MSYPVMSTSIPWSLIKGGFKKTPDFNTVVQPTAASRGDSSYSLKPYGTWLFEIDLAFVLGGPAIAASLVKSFLGTFMACSGRANYFQFTDPTDAVVGLDQGIMLNVTPAAPIPMGQAGDNASTLYQLARSVDDGVDILQNVTNLVVKVDGTTQALGSDYTVSDTGVVTFVTVPGAAAVLTWSGNFTYLCQFTDDNLKELAMVNKNSAGWVWDCPSIKFESRFV